MNTIAFIIDRQQDERNGKMRNIFITVSAEGARFHVDVAKRTTFGREEMGQAEVNWPSFGAVSAKQALIFSSVVAKAVEIALELDIEFAE